LSTIQHLFCGMKLSFSSVLCALILSLSIGKSFCQSQPGGFTHEWSSYAPGAFGPTTIVFDTNGLRAIEQVPAPGIHPRIYFGPSELPEIRQRLQTTLSGQEVMKQIHSYTTLLHFGYGGTGTYSHNASYAKDAFGNRRIDNAGNWSKHTEYYQLIALDPTALLGMSTSDKYKLASIMAMEAFECLIYAGQTDSTTGMDYDDRADDLAKAMGFWAGLVVGSPSLNWNNYHDFGGEHMALCYDLNYAHLSNNQRDSVRMGLAAITPPVPRYGHLTEAYASASNWAGLNAFEIMTNMAIEQETGYNPTLLKDYMRAYRNFITYGWYVSGTPLEGQGKNYQMNGILIALAKRGYSLLGHPNVRNYGSQYLPAAIQPYGHSFFSEDAWGGSGWDKTVGGYKMNPMDIVGLKWAMPNDPGVDFAWRNYIEKWYKLNSEGYVYQQILPATSGYHQYLIPAAIFAMDYNPGSWTTQHNNAVPERSFFAAERGKAMFRSSHDPDALHLQFLCRQDLGGHTYADRNNFTLSGLGRTWIRYTYGSSFQETQYHSCILIDSLGIKTNPQDGVKARQPGKVIGYSDSAKISQITGDATYAYSWEWDWEARPVGQDNSLLGSNGWTKVDETWNDFRYQPGSEAFYNIPFYDFADWRAEAKFERMVKRPANTLQRFYRTAAMIHMDKPFGLIIDDIQKDSVNHHYEWLAQIANDLVVDTFIVNHDTNDYRCDVILKEVTGDRRLLVRVLENKGYHQGNPARIDTLVHSINGNSPLTRLIIEADTIAPDFKVMLFPFEIGDSLPHTSWNSAYDLLTVAQQMDTIRLVFEPLGGRTWLSEYDPGPVVGTSPERIDLPLSVFPNPNNGRFSLTWDQKLMGSVDIEIIDSQGRSIMKTQSDPDSNEAVLDLSSDAAGLYFVKVSDAYGRSEVIKVIMK